MKKYAFLLFFTLLWATISPFVAFRLICGSFVPKNDFFSDTSFSQNSSEFSEESSENQYIKEETDEFSDNSCVSSAETESPISTIELLTANKLSEIDYQSYSAECQKALAVAVRTQIAFSRLSEEFSASTLSESVIKSNAETLPKCITETQGMIITYNQSPINAVFHKSSYKTTITSANGEKYLLSVETSENEDENKTVTTFSKEEFKSTIKELCYEVIFEEDEKIIKKLVYNEENRCSSINVGNCALSAEAFAKKLSLPSTAFTIEEKDNEIIIISYGEGSGIGLSIEGADSLANEGKSFDEIIKHYYTGVELENIT